MSLPKSRLQAQGWAREANLEQARRNEMVLSRPHGLERWARVLARMKEQRFSQGRMSRETGLFYKTVKRYLRRLEVGA